MEFTNCLWQLLCIIWLKTTQFLHFQEDRFVLIFPDILTSDFSKDILGMLRNDCSLYSKYCLLLLCLIFRYVLTHIHHTWQSRQHSKNKTIALIFFIILPIYLCVRWQGACCGLAVDVREQLEGLFPSNLWVLGAKIKSSGSVASNFTNWGLLLVLWF